MALTKLLLIVLSLPCLRPFLVHPSVCWLELHVSYLYLELKALEEFVLFKIQPLQSQTGDSGSHSSGIHRQHNGLAICPMGDLKEALYHRSYPAITARDKYPNRNRASWERKNRSVHHTEWSPGHEGRSQSRKWEICIVLAADDQEVTVSITVTETRVPRT